MYRERNTAGSWRRRTCRLWLALCGCCLIGQGALAQTGEGLTVRVEEGDTLRALAAEHLGDPDLWTEILRANGLSAITDVHPGLALRIPAAEVAQANRALEAALEDIQRATMEAPGCSRPMRSPRRSGCVIRGLPSARAAGGRRRSASPISRGRTRLRRSRWRSSSATRRLRPCSATGGDGSRASVRRICCGPIGT